MKILDRYITKNFVITFIFCSLSFMLLCILVELFNHLDDIFTKSIPTKAVAQYFLYYTPLIFSQVAPFSSVIAIIYVLGNMKKHNEIVAIKTSGGSSSIKILRPVFFVAILIGVLNFLNTNVLVPVSLQKRDTVYKQHFAIKEELAEKESPTLLRNVTLIGKKNNIYYAKKFNKKLNVLNDVIILNQSPSSNVLLKTTIERMFWRGNVWECINVSKFKINGLTGEFIGEPKFNGRVIIKTEESPKDFLVQYKKDNVEFLNVKQIHGYIQRIKAYQPKMARKLLLELMDRISNIFLFLITVIIASSISLKHTRKEIFLGLGETIVAIFLYYLTCAIFSTFAKGNYIPVILAGTFPHIIFFAIGCILIYKEN